MTYATAALQRVRIEMPHRQHIKPVIYETLSSKSLFFSIHDIQSRMDIMRPDELQLEYTRIMMGFLLHNPQPRSIAMIGLGGGSLAKFCYRCLPLADITVIEINPHVIAQRDTFFVPPDSHRFTVRQADAAVYLGETDEKFDVILADGFDIDGLPPALCSPQFYQDCNNALNPGGIFVANLHGCKPMFEIIVERIRATFAGNLLMVNDPDGSNRVAFAVKDDLQALAKFAVVRCPYGVDDTAWRELVPSMARVFLASRALARSNRAQTLA